MDLFLGEYRVRLKCACVQSGLALHCSLTHYQTTNFKLFQTERVCRQQFQILRKWQKVIQTDRKHCGKRRTCEQFLLFPQCFQKACFPGASKGVIVWEWVKPIEIYFYNHQHSKYSWMRLRILGEYWE